MINRVPRIGDTIRVHPIRVVEVNLGTSTSDGRVQCYGGNTYGFGEIEEVIPKKLEIGDEVIQTGESKYRSLLPALIRGKIIGIHEECAWVSTDIGRLTMRIEDLELVS